MKLTLLKESLEEKLQIASRFTTNKLLTGAAGGCTLELLKNQLLLSTNNLIDVFETSIQVEGQEDGIVVIDTKELLEYVHHLSPGPIEFTSTVKNLQLKQGTTKATFPLLAEEKNKDKKTVNGEAIVLKKEDISNLQHTLNAAAKDTSRPMLTAVNFSEWNGHSVAVCTDGFRLSLSKLKTKTQEPLLLVASTLGEFLRIANKDIHITKDKETSAVKIEAEENTLYTRIVEGEFPPFQKVIPGESTTKIVVKKQELLSKLKLVGVFARLQADVVVLSVEKKGVTLYPKGQQKDDTNAGVETESIEGEPLNITFNNKYVVDFLNNCDGDLISMECTQNTAPALFRDIANEEMLHIIMPLRSDEE